MDEVLDLRGLKCPLPALMTKKALAKCVPGARLTMLADDPLARIDIAHMCHGEGHTLTRVTTHESHSEFCITRG